MKNIKLIAGIFLLLTAFTFTSCDNEPIDPAIDLGEFGNPTAGPMSFKADFSGDTWTGTEAQALVSGNFISVGATRADGSTFSFFIEANAIGTYPANTNVLAYTPAGSEYGYWSTNFANPDENTGSVTVTSINTTAHTITGTFSFKGYWSDTTNTSIIPVQFTNGVFNNIPYITQDQTGDTFFAKVGGTEFVDVDLLAVTSEVGGVSYIGIGAEDASLNTISVSVRNDLATGTYPITGSLATDGVQGIYESNSVEYTSVSGSVTISSKTAGHIKGTFNFIGAQGTNTKTITEGAFDLDY